jgi:hypothetical protein
MVIFLVILQKRIFFICHAGCLIAFSSRGVESERDFHHLVSFEEGGKMKIFHVEGGLKNYFYFFKHNMIEICFFLTNKY